MGLFDFFTGAKAEEQTQEELDQEHREKDFSSFHRVTDFIYHSSGITDLDKRAFTASKLQNFALSSEIYTTQEFLSALQNDTHFYQEVMNIATVNESFFLRELSELEWLVTYILKENRKLKILSMPCATGEEVYSILILLKKKNFEISKIEITGYDLNSSAIKLAQAARYDDHSIHKLDASSIAEYFEQEESGFYKVKSVLKNSVAFEQQNIFEITETQKYDIVLSRNMFIYFDDAKREEALNIIHKLLKQDGIYIKGHADQIHKHNGLENIAYGIYKKA